MFLGTPRGYKGVDDLAAAVARLGAATSSWRWSGPSLTARRAAAALDMRGAPADRPHPIREVPQYLEAADVVVVPQRDSSDTRGQVPAKLFDAMALGRPIVSTRVSMIPEMIEGCGVLVPPGDVPALALPSGGCSTIPRRLRRSAAGRGAGRRAL